MNSLVNFIIVVMTLVISSWKANGQAKQHFDVVVAQDGSGHFTTITDAINAIPSKRSNRTYIKIKAGHYNETIIIGVEKTNVTIVGDGRDNTIISGNRSNAGGFHTFETATFAIDGGGFVAQDMTIQNTAGPESGQAVALRSQSNFSVFYRCKIVGYQDTLLANQGNQFFRECDIYGTVDFIFGHAKVIFQNCNIYGQRPLKGQSITITAQNRDTATEDSGTVIHNCTISATPDLRASGFPVKMYLGRPWSNYSTTIVMQSILDELIDPMGWLDWDGRSLLGTISYAEYNNRGPGANISDRVNWKGYKVMRSYKEATKFTVRKFINGDTWIPLTGVPYEPDLIKNM